MNELTTEERIEFPFPHQQEAVQRIVADRLAAERERLAVEVETEAAAAWGGDAPWVTTGQRVADVCAGWIRAAVRADPPEATRD